MRGEETKVGNGGSALRRSTFDSRLGSDFHVFRGWTDSLRDSGIAFTADLGDSTAMSNRELVIDLVTTLPEDTPLEEIARELELLAGLKTAREQARRGEGLPAQDARKLVDTWAAR